MGFENRLVTVIIPCYNHAVFLPDALESVLNQTYKYWECIIINDGSEDHTEAIALDWIKKDTRFSYLKKPNGGLSQARNDGLKLAKGHYIQFLDADDGIHPKKLEIQVEQLSKAGENSLSFTDYYCSISNDLNLVDPSWYLSPRFTTHNYMQELITNWETRLSIPVHCFLFSKKLFSHYDITFNPQLPNHEDWDCWINIFKLNPEVFYVDNKLAIYRLFKNGLSSNHVLMHRGFLTAIKMHMEKFPSNSKPYKLLVNKYYQVKYGVTTNNKGILVILITGVILKKAIKKVINSILIFTKNKDVA